MHVFTLYANKGELFQVINLCLVDNCDTLVQRVSSASFVVRCDVSQRHPLGLLHIMFFKPNKFESSDKRFLCACRPYKQVRVFTKFGECAEIVFGIT